MVSVYLQALVLTSIVPVLQIFCIWSCHSWLSQETQLLVGIVSYHETMTTVIFATAKTIFFCSVCECGE